MNYFFKILIILYILTFTQGKKVLSENPILHVQMNRHSENQLYFKLDFESTDQMVVVGFGKDYYPADVVVCELLNDCIDSYVVGLKNVKQGLSLQNLQINADVSQINKVKGTNDISNYLVQELKNSNQEVIGYSYSFTKTISTSDIFDIQLYNDDPEISFIWMYDYQGEFYKGKVSIHGLNVGEERKQGTMVEGEEIITGVHVKVEQSIYKEQLFQLWTLTLGATADGWIAAGVGKHQAADGKHAFVGDCFVVYLNNDNEWVAYDAWANGDAEQFFRRDYDLNDPYSIPEFNNVQLVSRVASGNVVIKVKRLMETDKWDLPAQMGMNEIFVAYENGFSGEPTNSLNKAGSKQANLKILSTQMTESDYVDQVMKQITLPVSVTGLRVWLEMTEIEGEKYYHFKVEKDTQGWFYIGFAKNNYPADVVFCNNVAFTPSCVDGFIQNKNNQVESDGVLGGRNDLEDVSGVEITGPPIIYEFQFKKKVYTNDVFDFVFYGDDNEYQWIVNQDASNNEIQDSAATSPQGVGVTTIDKIDTLPTGEYRNEPEVEPMVWTKLDDAEIYIGEGEKSGIKYQIVAINIDLNKMGWVAVGIGKINGNKHLGDVIVFYQISDSDEWTAVDGYALDGTIYKDTDTTLDANAQSSYNNIDFLYRDLSTAGRIIYSARKSLPGDIWDYEFKKGKNDIFVIYGVNYNKTPPFPIDLGLDKAADEKKRPNLKLEEHLIVPDPGENPFPSEEEPGTAYDPDQQTTDQEETADDQGMIMACLMLVFLLGVI